MNSVKAFKQQPISKDIRFDFVIEILFFQCACFLQAIYGVINDTIFFSSIFNTKAT